MYLKSLELQGFKSFPDRVTLDFDKGITAVVGPNGSGKSNIGDAVRWVLGEQSTKTLRGSKMEDVIFSGTQKRKPTGFASVTLNIDNSDAKITDVGNEISVTRKYYRSGESEYILNGKNVRLKDIHELFMDTGLGRDGYSIIGQGRIAEIVGVKSEERRAIFEEAAGISKFRYKKEDAEKKLAAAEENLTRLHDIANGLEERLGPLHEQAKKAVKYLDLAKKKETLEVSLWDTELDEIKEKQTDLNKNSIKLANEIEVYDIELEKQSQSIKKGYDIIQKTDVEIENTRYEINGIRKRLEDARSQKAVLENDIKHGNERIERLKNDIKDLEKKQEESSKMSLENENQKTQKNRKIKETEDNLAGNRAKLSENEALQSEISKNLNELLENKSHLLQRQSDLREIIAALSAKTESAIESDKGKTENIKRLEEEKQAAENNLHQAEKALEENLKQSESTKKSIEEKTSKLEKFKDEIVQATQKYKILSDRLSQAKQRLHILSDMEKNMEGYSGSVKRILSSGMPGIFGTVSEAISTDENLGVAIETALGGQLQNIIVEDEDTAKQAIKYLRDKKAGRCTFLPTTSVKGRVSDVSYSSFSGYIGYASDLVKYDARFDGIIKYLLGRTAVFDNIDNATAAAKRCGYRTKIVTLDGQVINSGGSFTGGSVLSKAGLLSRKAEIDSLKKQVAETSEKYENWTLQIKKAEDNLKIKENALQEEKSLVIWQDTEKARIQERSEAAKKTLDSLNANLEAAKADYDNKDIKFAEDKTKLKTSKNELIEVENSIRENDAKLNELNESLSLVSRRKNEYMEKISSLSIELATLKSSLENLDLENSRIRAEIENSKTAFENAAREMDEIKAAEQGARGKIAESEELLKSSDEKITDLENKSSELHEKRNENEKIIRNLQNGSKETTAAREHTLSEKTRTDEKINDLKQRYDKIIGRLLDDYNLTRTEAKTRAQKIDDRQRAANDLADLKQQIKRLGTVNVMAVEEEKEVKEKYDFLTHQLEDIRQSKSELEELILKLTDEMSRVFSQSFEKIRRNFREIFTELFGGGKADLKLSDPDNVLTSGIEIIVAPPGKVIKNLISLSGGEQSFVAVCIYFAILRLNPAPFCILDEIDAALDEVNVAKYAKYLKNFTDTTQFILVTHRRGAMEEAGVLYGVTMQEDGISKLLKLDQREEFEKKDNQ